jgi:hypothetical protein
MFPLAAGCTCRNAGDTGAQRTSQTVQAELIDLVQRRGVLEIVLDDIDVVGGGQKTCEFGRFGVPQRS